MTTSLRLMTVHAHPDDESSKGAGTVAKYVDDGAHAVLVCCTGGELGDILNPALDNEHVRANLHEIRRNELAAATKIIGYRDVEMLGYRDSGMAGTEANADPACFARADATEAVGKLVEMIRRYRPQVLVTYGDDQEVYPHPDHLRVHDISVAAFDAAADPYAYVDLGAPWQVSKLYYSTFPLAKLQLVHTLVLEAGEESPFPDSLMEMPSNDHAITTRVDTAAWSHVVADALRAHATQIDPESVIWFSILPEVEKRLGAVDEYVLARSHVESDESRGDLFDGIPREEHFG